MSCLRVCVPINEEGCWLCQETCQQHLFLLLLTHALLLSQAGMGAEASHNEIDDAVSSLSAALLDAKAAISSSAATTNITTSNANNLAMHASTEAHQHAYATHVPHGHDPDAHASPTPLGAKETADQSDLVTTSKQQPPIQFASPQARAPWPIPEKHTQLIIGAPLDLAISELIAAGGSDVYCAIMLLNSFADVHYHMTYDISSRQDRDVMIYAFNYLDVSLLEPCHFESAASFEHQNKLNYSKQIRNLISLATGAQRSVRRDVYLISIWKKLGLVNTQ